MKNLCMKKQSHTLVFTVGKNSEQGVTKCLMKSLYITWEGHIAEYIAIKLLAKGVNLCFIKNTVNLSRRKKYRVQYAKKLIMTGRKNMFAYIVKNSFEHTP